MKKINFLILLGLFIPYWLVGIDIGNSILLGSGLCVLAFGKSLKFRKSEMLLALSLSALGAISIFRSSNIANSLEGLSLYLALPVFIVLFRTYITEASWKESGKIFSLGVLLTAAISIGITFLFQTSRLEGFMSYSNSYGLLLLVAYIFYRCFGDKRIFSSSAEVLFIWGIFLTGSRITLGLLGFYLFWEVFRGIKKRQPLFFLLYLGLSIGLYVLYELSKPWALYAFLLILTVDYLFKPETTFLKKLKHPNGWIISLASLSGIGFFFTNSSLLHRVREISLETGVLQERFIIFQDGITGIAKNLMGYGINSFPYMQYYNQTAFYDVRYIHNSILQVGFDIGILGAIAFIGLLVIWAKNLKPEMLWVMGIIIFHSMLDFDLSYFLLYIPLLLITSPKEETLKIVPITLKSRIILAAIGMVVFYTISTSTLFMFAETAINEGKYDQGIAFLKVEERLSPKNSELHILEAQAYFLKEDKSSYALCESSLKQAIMENPYDLRAFMNLGFLYKKMLNYEGMIPCFKKTVEIQKYNPELYKRSIQAIHEFSAENKRNGGAELDFQKDEKWFRTKYSESLKSLNPRAKYLRNQLAIIE